MAPLSGPGIPKKAVVAKPLNGRKVALAQAEQTDVAENHIGMGDGPIFEPGDLVQALGQASEAFEAQADQGYRIIYFY